MAKKNHDHNIKDDNTNNIYMDSLIGLDMSWLVALKPSIFLECQVHSGPYNHFQPKAFTVVMKLHHAQYVTVRSIDEESLN